jgi:hypothetical protein
MLKRIIKFNRRRKFGAELEYNTPSNGILSQTLRRLNEPVRTTEYQHTTDVSDWYCKVDGSCGYEVSSKVLSGPRDIKLLGDVLLALKQDGARFDNRCGQHIHVETRDFSHEQKQILAMYWIKIENFLMNAHKEHRRNNHYCSKANSYIQNFIPNQTYAPQDVYNAISGRRGALNIGGNVTTEFRFGHMTEDSEELKNRVRFLVWFVDICKIMPVPPNLNWFTPKQAMRFMGLWSEQTDQIQKIYSPAIISMKKWILNQFKINAPVTHYHKDIQTVSEMIEEINVEETKAKESTSLEVTEEFSE